MTRYTEYDRFARVYGRHWSGFSQRVLPVLDRLLLANLPAGSRLLDVCCGAGHLAAALVERGWRVTGLDGSEEMIRLARERAPAASFAAMDARAFVLPQGGYDAAMCLFDSLNHMMGLRDLTAVLRNVRAALVEGGGFVFDMNMQEGYLSRWHGSIDIVEDDCVCVVRARFEPETSIGYNDVTLFELDGQWRRTDLRMTQRCYSQEEVLAALAETGFTDVRTYDARNDLQMDTGTGRRFFVGRRSPGAA